MIETGLGLYIDTDHDFEFEVLAQNQRSVQDITGWALSFQVRPTIDSDTILLEKTTADGITIAGTYHSNIHRNEQVATAEIEAADTDGLESQNAIWELKRTDSGSETVLGTGPFVFTRGVHHS